MPGHPRSSQVIPFPFALPFEPMFYEPKMKKMKRLQQVSCERQASSRQRFVRSGRRAPQLIDHVGRVHV